MLQRARLRQAVEAAALPTEVDITIDGSTHSLSNDGAGSVGQGLGEVATATSTSDTAESARSTGGGVGSWKTLSGSTTEQPPPVAATPSSGESSGIASGSIGDAVSASGVGKATARSSTADPAPSTENAAQPPRASRGFVPTHPPDGGWTGTASDCLFVQRQAGVALARCFPLQTPPRPGKSTQSEPFVLLEVNGIPVKEIADYCGRNLEGDLALCSELTAHIVQGLTSRYPAVVPQGSNLISTALGFQSMSEWEQGFVTRLQGEGPNEYGAAHVLQAARHAARCRDVAFQALGMDSEKASAVRMALATTNSVLNGTEVFVQCTGRLVYTLRLAAIAEQRATNDRAALALWATAYAIAAEAGFGVIVRSETAEPPVSRIPVTPPELYQNKLLFDAEQLELILLQKQGFEATPKRAPQPTKFDFDAAAWRPLLSEAQFPSQSQMSESEVEEALELYERAIMSAGGLPAVGLLGDWRWRDEPGAGNSRASELVTLGEPETEAMKEMMLLRSAKQQAITEPVDSLLQPDLNFASMASSYLRASPHAVAIDNALSDDGLETLQHLLQSSRIWHIANDHAVLTDVFHGLATEPIAQLAEELRARMPQLLCSHAVRDIFATSYDRIPEGGELRVSNGSIGVMIWLTEQDAASVGGEFQLFPAQVPDDIDLADYEAGLKTPSADPRIESLVREYAGRVATVEHKSNRMVIFDATVLHRSAELAYQPGFKNRRLELTFIFGQRGHSCEDAAASHDEALRQAVLGGLVV